MTSRLSDFQNGEMMVDKATGKPLDLWAPVVSRPSNLALDELLDQKIPVLDDGFVMVKDYMGGDSSVVQAARVSYGAGTKHVSEDRGLIRYLMRHYHTTPFEMPSIEFLVRVPMDHWRQWIRHRTASVNEYSTRYSIAIDDCQTTLPEEWRLQDAGNKQGSDGFLPVEVGAKLTEKEFQLHKLSREIYQERLDAGVAREQARKDLTLSTYTEAYWKMDLHNLLHFLRLRMDPHAQKEIRDYATVIGEKIVAAWCPMVWEAFQDYRLNSMPLTAIDLEFIRLMNSEGDAEACQFLADKGLLSYSAKNPGTLLRNRERDELGVKLQRMGMRVPW